MNEIWDIDNFLSFCEENDIRLVKLKYKEKVPAVKWKEYADTNAWLKEKHQIKEDLIAKRINIAGALGYGNVIVLDIENKELANNAFNMEKLKNDTFIVETNRGYHIYFTTDDTFKNEHVGTLFEIRAKNCLVVLPPSTHPEGKEYKFFGALKLMKIDREQMELAKKRLLETAKKLGLEVPREQNESAVAKTDNNGHGAKIMEGGRNDYLFKTARSLAKIYKDEDELIAKLYEINLTKCEPPLPKAEVISIAKSSYRYVTDSIIEELKIILGDVGEEEVSKKMVDIREKIAMHIIDKYNPLTFMDTEEVFAYNEKTKLYENSEQFFVKKIQYVMDNLNIGKYNTTHNTSEIVNTIKRRTMRKREEIEAPPYLIPFRNCILDFRPDGDGVMEYGPDKFFTTKLNVDYDPSADCPEFDWFLHELFDNEDDRVRVYQMIGYCLLRDYPLHRAFMLVGEGANGKSVLLKTIEEILGRDNVSHLSIQQIETERFSLDALYGKFANIYADLSSTELKTTGRFKNLTSGDAILIEKKYGGTYSLKNTAKFLFSCNQLPVVKDDTDGFYRRWIIISFNNQFIDGVNADPYKIKKITTEREKSGIVNKALFWLEQVLLQNKFYKEEDVDTKRDRYRKLSSSILAFIDEKLTYSENYIEKDRLYAVYLRYCKENQLPASSEKKFFMTIKTEMNVEEERLTTVDGRKRVLVGIGLKENAAG